MPSVINVGGSLTGAVFITLIAWGIRFVRRAHARTKVLAEAAAAAEAPRKPAFLAPLSPAALCILMETNPLPHRVYVVERSDPLSTSQSPLPSELRGATRVTVQQLEALLTGHSASTSPQHQAQQQQQQQQQHAPLPTAATLTQHQHAAPDPPRPSRRELIVIVSEAGEAAASRAVAAAARGEYQRVAVVPGGVTAVAERGGSGHTDIRFIGRDALAAILGMTSLAIGVPILLLDVRRADERVLYGSLAGSVHVPADQLPSALQLPPQTFFQAYRFPKPAPGTAVVLHSRTSKRAVWAAQLCADAGLDSVLVYRAGVYGWRFDESVKQYKSYELGEAPPEPEMSQLEAPNEEAALKDLQALNLMRSVGGFRLG